jgi:hypothetical protein
MLCVTRNVKKYKNFEFEEYEERERDRQTERARGRQLREGSKGHRDEIGNA